MGEDLDAAAEPVNVYEQLTEPGPLSRDELEGGADDYQLWIVRAPPQLNAAELQYCKLPLTAGRSTRSDTLELVADTFVPQQLHLLLPNRKGKKLRPVSVPLAGQVLVHQRLDVPEVNVADTPVTSLLPDPPQVRPDRHPLLGIGYKKILKRCSEGLARSQALDDSRPSGSKKRRSEAAASELLPSPEKRKKKKKH